MKTQKGLLVLATVSLLGLSVACSDRYEEGFAKGKDQGYLEGYDEGYADGDLDGYDRGYSDAEAFFASADYNSGYADGKNDGVALGYSQGYNVGNSDGFAAGKAEGYSFGYDDGYDDGYLDGDANAYTEGYNVGYTDGSLDGYDLGYDDGALDGYDLGYDDGSLDGYDIGYDDGFADGYDVGYDDGYYALSVGKTKSLQGYANILSMAHNDIFDYSAIKAPKLSARGVVANGRLLFEETSLTNKDTLKRAAVVEQYLVVEMAKQVHGKMGLSAERSLKIAKAANHFRKFATKRALTNEDTNAYVKEIIGTDLRSIEKAVEAGDMSSVLESAASKNGTTPEKMAEIIAKHFI